MVSSVAAQDLNTSDQLSGEDWDGTQTETNSSLEGSNAQDSGDNLENETTSVDVRVTSKVAIDVTPESLNYPFVDLGEQETISNRSYESLTIMNTGSEPVDRVWVNGSFPSNDPFGDGTGSYEAGNFFQINISESTSNQYTAQTPDPASSYHYVNRVEYMFQGEDEVPSFIRAPNGTGEVTIDPSGSDTSPSELEKGALRVGGEEYYYVVLEDPSGGCDGSGEARIRIGNTPFTSDQQGTLDFTNDGPDQQSADWTSYTMSQGQANNVGIVDPDLGNLVDIGNRKYTLLASCDTAVADDRENLVRTRYNPTALSFNDLNNGAGGTQFIFSASSRSAALEPSEFITLDTAVEVPRGVDQGSMNSGTFRVFVTSDNA